MDLLATDAEFSTRNDYLYKDFKTLVIEINKQLVEQPLRVDTCTQTRAPRGPLGAWQ